MTPAEIRGRLRSLEDAHAAMYEALAKAVLSSNTDIANAMDSHAQNIESAAKQIKTTEQYATQETLDEAKGLYQGHMRMAAKLRDRAQGLRSTSL